jgi:mediator of replication checkpoint protein 1
LTDLLWLIFNTSERREHLEEEDEKLQKLHQDAIEGKYRTKRRDRGVGFDESDSEGEDDTNRRIRQKIAKKRRINDDTLDALGKF